MELYHVLNRGVDKRKIFMDNGDRVRFVHDMYEFNDTIAANNTSRSLSMNDIVSRSSDRDRLVDIHGWCLMGNHYHLLLSEKRDGGISDFIRKLNVGYARYFNDKHRRSGALFQGRTKRILINSDAHFLHILHYIHLNPLDFVAETAQWRRLKIRNTTQALAYLDSYRWSSYLDYCGSSNFASVITRDLFGDVFKDYRHTIRQYLRDIEIDDVLAYTLE